MSTVVVVVLRNTDKPAESKQHIRQAPGFHGQTYVLEALNANVCRVGVGVSEDFAQRRKSRHENPSPLAGLD